MKSAAFNLAFKVHRNEMPFAEGLMKSVEAQAQHDFIEALNSLAGETRYDINKLDQLVAEAQSGTAKKAEKKVDTSKIEEELEKYQKELSELNEYIQSLKNRMAAFRTTVIPGINSALIGIVGAVIVIILFILEMGLATLLVLVVTLGAGMFTLAQDLDVLKKQQKDVAQKKLRVLSELETLETSVSKIKEKIKEKKGQLKEAKSGSSSTSEESESHSPSPDPSPEPVG